jgi:hypothetical protein
MTNALGWLLVRYRANLGTPPALAAASLCKEGQRWDCLMNLLRTQRRWRVAGQWRRLWALLAAVWALLAEAWAVVAALWAVVALVSASFAVVWAALAAVAAAVAALWAESAVVFA